MRTIKIKRPVERFNKNCTYDIYFGKERIVKLNNGEEKTFEIDSNVVYVQAKIFWCSSKKIILTNTTWVEEFEIRGNKFLNRTFPLLAIIPLFGISFTMNSNQEILKFAGICLLFLLLAFVIAVFTIKRDKWLIIKRIN